MTKRCFPYVFVLILMILSACKYGDEAPIFDVSGSPSPLFYGADCGRTVLTLKVDGPGDGLEIKSIIAAYQLFDGGGKKISEATLSLNPIPGATPVSYDADRIIAVPETAGSAPDSPIFDFGDGRVDFAATVYAKILSPAPSGPEETYYFTSTKSIPVLPCGSTPAPLTKVTIVPILPPGLNSGTLIAPGSFDQPTKESGGGEPPAPPSCSVEPNNPNCVP